MDYQLYKSKQLLTNLVENISSISNFTKLSIDDLKVFNSNLSNNYSIDENKSPINEILTELELLQKNINDSILVNLRNELLKMK